jgi:putative membrane protein
MEIPKTPGAERKEQNSEEQRVRFAAERTLLAWIRTGLALMGFGFVVARFGLFLHEVAMVHQAAPVHSTGSSLWIGTGLVILGICVTLLSAFRHWCLIRRLNRREGYTAPRCPLGLIVSLVLAFLGSMMVVYLLLQVGVVRL